MDYKKYIRIIDDFPIEGISFKDITTLIKNGSVQKQLIDDMVDKVKDKDIDIVIGPEARGFMIGAPVAYALGAGFVPVRKEGKLPSETLSVTYDKEYGKDTLQIHKDAIKPGQNVLVVDDLIATGGTIEAVCELVEKAGANVSALLFTIELEELKAREKLSKYEFISLIKYDK